MNHETIICSPPEDIEEAIYSLLLRALEHAGAMGAELAAAKTQVLELKACIRRLEPR